MRLYASQVRTSNKVIFFSFSWIIHPPTFWTQTALYQGGTVYCRVNWPISGHWPFSGHLLIWFILAYSALFSQHHVLFWSIQQGERTVGTPCPVTWSFVDLQCLDIWVAFCDYLLCYLSEITFSEAAKGKEVRKIHSDFLSIDVQSFVLCRKHLKLLHRCIAILMWAPIWAHYSCTI